jgi:F-type H+-transporting ATPase subunit epsilon
VADHPVFPVSVVTPEGAAFEGDAEMVIVPGQSGEIGVLSRHAPLVAMLKAGSTRVHLYGGEVREFATGPGFFQVLDNRAIALVDDAVAAGEIDTARAQKQLEDAQAELHGRQVAARAAHPPRREPALGFRRLLN